MSRRTVVIAFVATVSLALPALTAAMGGAGRTGPGTPVSPIQHFVLIMKENRSFDHLFGTFPGATGATTGVRSDGTVFPLPHGTDAMQADLGHSAGDFYLAYDNGHNDGFDLEKNAVQNGVYASYEQLYQQDIPNTGRTPRISA